jgi:phage tail sheath protein FI
MPVNPTFPGVYIDELPSAVRTITGVPTSIAAFVGTAPKGVTDRPMHITSFSDYEREFGGLAVSSPLSYAVFQFYQNGGSEAEIVRVAAGDALKSTVTLPGANGVVLEATSPGVWADDLRVRVEYPSPDDDPTVYNLLIGTVAAGVLERYLNVSIDPLQAGSLDNQLASSQLFRVKTSQTTRPGAHPGVVPFGGNPFEEANPTWFSAAGGGDDGGTPDTNDFVGSVAGKTGINQLLKTDIFNLVALPGAAGQDAAVIAATAKLALDRRAMFIVDPPSSWGNVDDAATKDLPVAGNSAKNAAVYFPSVKIADPLRGGTLQTFPPSGTVAGVWARTDVERGVWKAPAGTAASLNGVREPTVPMTDLENGRLNPRGVNALRQFPVVGNVVWGARTLRGADQLADQWKYLPVRRLALFIEESLFRGTQWVVFEPNDEPLWSSIRLNVGAFMNNLFRQGAFQGRTPQEAYLVKCDSSNNPQNDIDRGIVNILVGFAPLKPAEFVIIHIQQLAGQIQV